MELTKIRIAYSSRKCHADFPRRMVLPGRMVLPERACGVRRDCTGPP
jgi:hypothetical protein